jgi:hypothetical protein
MHCWPEDHPGNLVVLHLSAELVVAQSGLGALIWQGKDWRNLPLVLVGIVTISISVLIAERIERCCCRGSAIAAPDAAAMTAQERGSQCEDPT